MRNYQRSIETSSYDVDPTTIDRCVNGASLQFDRRLSIFKDMDHGGGNDSEDDSDDDDDDHDDKICRDRRLLTSIDNGVHR